MNYMYLNLISQGTGVVTVQGCNEYHKQIFEYTTDPADPTNDIVDFTADQSGKNKIWPNFSFSPFQRTSARKKKATSKKRRTEKNAK